MSEKPMTVAEMARMGGIARAKAYSKAQLRTWGRRGGRPAKLDRKTLTKLQQLLAAGKSHGECAKLFAVSLRTIGRAVTRTMSGARRVSSTFAEDMNLAAKAAIRRPHGC